MKIRNTVVPGIFFAILLMPVAKADITYDFSGFGAGGASDEFSFTEPDFLTTTTVIPFADLTIETEPSPCSISSVEVYTPFSSPGIGQFFNSGGGCEALSSGVSFSTAWTRDGTYSNGAPSPSIMTISGSPADVPEPASLLLLGTALLAAETMLKRRALARRSDKR